MIAKKKLIEEFYKLTYKSKNISFILKEFTKILIENGAINIEANFDNDLKYLYIKFRWKRGRNIKNAFIDYGKWLGVHLTYY